MNIFIGFHWRNGFQEDIHLWKVKHVPHGTERGQKDRLLIIAVVLLLITSLTVCLPLPHIHAATHWHATYLLIYVISKFASYEAKWLGDKVLEISWLKIYHQFNLFSCSAEDRLYNKRSDTKFLSFNPKKGMKFFYETLASTSHQPKADLQLKDIPGFAINKRRQIDLFLSDFFSPRCFP